MFVLSFKRTAWENNITKDYRDSFSHYYVPKVKTKDYNVLIDRKSFFDLPVKNEEKLTNGAKNGVKIAVPLKYLSKFWRSLQMPLISCKVELSLNWIENCVLTTTAIGANVNAPGADSAIFKITDAKLYVSVVTLSTKGNAKLAKRLSEGFKRLVYWNKCKVIDNKVVEINDANVEKHIREFLKDFCSCLW